jgi:hypothetical protein
LVSPRCITDQFTTFEAPADTTDHNVLRSCINVHALSFASTLTVAYSQHRIRRDTSAKRCSVSPAQQVEVAVAPPSPRGDRRQRTSTSMHGITALPFECSLTAPSVGHSRIRRASPQRTRPAASSLNAAGPSTLEFRHFLSLRRRLRQSRLSGSSRLVGPTRASTACGCARQQTGR